MLTKTKKTCNKEAGPPILGRKDNNKVHTKAIPPDELRGESAVSCRREGATRRIVPTDAEGRPTRVHTQAPFAGRMVRHGNWQVEVFWTESCAVVAMGEYHVGFPRGDWEWYFGAVVDDVFTPHEVIGRARFDRGGLNMSARLFHRSVEVVPGEYWNTHREDARVWRDFLALTPDWESQAYVNAHKYACSRSPNREIAKGTALYADFKYGERASTWEGFDVHGKCVWTGDFQEDASVHTRVGPGLSSEASAGKLGWVRMLGMTLPSHGAYQLLLEHFVAPIVPIYSAEV